VRLRLETNSAGFNPHLEEDAGLCYQNSETRRDSGIMVATRPRKNRTTVMNYALRNSVVVRLRVSSWIVVVRAGKKN